MPMVFPLVRSALAAILVLATDAAGATNWVVHAGGSRQEFVPRELLIQPGDSVTFRNLGGLHNVTADDGSFRCANGCDGLGGNGAASAQIWSATLTFVRSGRHGYFCEPHGAPGEGMHGAIVVAGAPPVAVPANGLIPRMLLAGLLLLSGALLARR
ncbi:MAG: hypothetical protein IT479_04210 [Xanthomonadales bacterium]|nr:hypothetical protein [Xanthomonadales bacterium]